jgi:hypothetical protein
VLLGVAFGLVCVRWLRTANRPLKEVDTTVQIGITLCVGYLTFFTAQFVLEISGVLACVSAGIVVSWLAQVKAIMLTWRVVVLIVLVLAVVVTSSGLVVSAGIRRVCYLSSS